jgi:hypothetical protein
MMGVVGMHGGGFACARKHTLKNKRLFQGAYTIQHIQADRYGSASLFRCPLPFPSDHVGAYGRIALRP